MEVFLSSIISYPTVIYTVLLTVLVFCLLLTILGMFDIDFFDLNIDGAEASGFAGLMVSWGLSGLPITISFSILFLYAWVISYFTTLLIPSSLDTFWFKALLGTAILIGSFAISVWLTAKTIRPFAKYFDTGSTAPTHLSLIGTTVTVRSSVVNQDAGEAVHQKDGISLILKVRTSEEHSFKKGDKVVIYDYDDSTNIYFVTPEQLTL